MIASCLAWHSMENAGYAEWDAVDSNGSVRGFALGWRSVRGFRSTGLVRFVRLCRFGGSVPLQVAATWLWGRLVTQPQLAGEIKVSTSTVAALFSKMALTGQRIAMVDMVFLVLYSISISTVGVDAATICL